jgi:hypothetical protein
VSKTQHATQEGAKGDTVNRWRQFTVSRNIPVPEYPRNIPYPSHDDWKQAVARSSVGLPWDPDHEPSGAKLERRASQLGLGGNVLARYAREWVVRIEDVSAFSARQRP